MSRKIGLFAHDAHSITRRLPKVRAWLVTYNPSEIIELRKEPNTAHYTALKDDAKSAIKKLHDYLAGQVASVTDLEEMVYAIPKHPDMSPQDIKLAQRQFFKDVYMLLIGKETGPRLSTFLWAVDRPTVLAFACWISHMSEQRP